MSLYSAKEIKEDKMATLDISILEFLTPAFTFLFILVISYAILDKFKLLGDKVAPKLLAAFSVSMLFIFSKEKIIYKYFVVFC